MRTPLLDAAERYLRRDMSRFHMPGHKGVAKAPFWDALPWDLTEIPGLDSLYAPDGPIAESEALFARLYGAKASLLSAEGSSLCVQTMLALALHPGDSLIAARGVHASAVNAMALLDLHPSWIYPSTNADSGLMEPVSPTQVEAAIRENPSARAVYLTSPDYFGITADIAGIAAVCKSYGKYLLVDGAHCPHYRFLNPPMDPISLGADLCCNSLHKILPALTGAAVLHVGNPDLVKDAKQRMALFGSTSPSYLILLSCDNLLPYLAEEFSPQLHELALRVGECRQLAEERGMLLPGGVVDPIRLTMGFGAMGYTADEFRVQMELYQVEPEYTDSYYCVLLPGVDNSPKDWKRLEKLLCALERKAPLPLPACPGTGGTHYPTEQACSLRDAAFAPTVTLPVEESAGRIAGATVAPCPPGVPLALPGERIGEETAELLKRCGILQVNVLQ